MLRSTSENLASNKDIRDRIKTELLPLAKHVRNDRRTMREKWLRWWRIWSVIPDQEAYRGRIRNYIPIARRECEQWTQRILQTLFPPDTYFGVRALRQSLERRVPLIDALFRYFMDHHMQIKRYAKPFVRQMVTLGTSPVKVVWRVSERDQPILRDILNMDGDPIGVERALTKVVDYIGPTFQPCDLFGCYVWPTMVTDADEAMLVFEDILLDQSTIEGIGKRYLDPDDEDLGHVYENIDELKEKRRALDTKDKIDSERRRLTDLGFTHPMDAALPPQLQPYDIAEYVWRANLDDEGVKKWLIVIGAEDVPLRVQPVRDVWWTDKAPWLFGKFLEVENEFYGRSVMETIDKLQYFTNDIANQASDALVWSLNPITVVDMFKIHDPNSLRNLPGAKWLGEVGAVEMKEPPKESAVVGFNALQQFMGIIDQASAPGPISVGVNKQRSRSAQSAVAQQINAAEAMTPIKDIVEGLQEQVFVPLMYRMHVLSWQCLDRDLILQIASTDGAPMVERKVSVSDIVGDFEFTWLGSTAVLNSQVRAQQMITFLGIYAKIPPEQRDDPGVKYMLRAIWREGFQLPGSERAIPDKKTVTSIDPRVENDLFRMGRGDDVIVAESDNDDEHIAIHTPRSNLPGMAQHIQAHQAAKMAKQIMKIRQQAQLQGMQNAARPGPGGAPPTMPGGNGAGLNPTGNPGRPPTTAGMDDLFRSMPRGTA